MRWQKKTRVGCDETSVTAPRATSEAKHPPSPHLYNKYFHSTLPHSSHLVVSVSAPIAVSVLLLLLSLPLLTVLEKPISVPSVLFRRAQISSQVRIKRPQRTPPSFSLLYSHLYLFVQLGLSLSLPPLSLLRHSLLQIFVRNLNLRKKNVTLNTFYSPWPLAFNRLLPLLIHAPPPMS